jgi:hypothetical protein
MEHTSGKAPRTSRPVDVAGFGGFHPAEAGADARSEPEAALGTSLRRRSPDTSAASSRSFDTCGRALHTRQAAETLWTLSGAAQRTALGPGEVLPGSQEDGLNPHEDREREFCMGLCIHHKTLLLKGQAKKSGDVSDAVKRFADELGVTYEVVRDVTGTIL